jgi:hypothetical protein
MSVCKEYVRGKTKSRKYFRLKTFGRRSRLGKTDIKLWSDVKKPLEGTGYEHVKRSEPRMIF